MTRQAPPLAVDSQTGLGATAAATPSGSSASQALLRDCFEVFHSTATEVARLSIETTNDLFEMDPLVTSEEVCEFRSRRSEWVTVFGAALRELFERRLDGQRRKRRRPDAELSLGSLRLLDDSDTSRQNALGEATKRLAAAAEQELAALDYRVSFLFDDPPSRETDNPFSPAYLLDAIGMTSRSLYAQPRVWRPLMEEVVSDFVPAVNQVYVRLNRFLAERGVLPEIGARLRARSDLRPVDDRQLLPLFGRLLNDVHPSLQAWLTLDSGAIVQTANQLASPDVNPYVAAVADLPLRSTSGFGRSSRLDAVVVPQALSPVLETLDRWQHADPMAAHLRSSALSGSRAAVTVLNRIPWIRAAIASQVTDERERCVLDVVGLMFDYVLRDPSIPPAIRTIFDGLQVPVLKMALVDPGFFADCEHPARRLIDDLADAAVGAGDDDGYGNALATLATSIVETICAEFALDAYVFERERRTLKKFTDDWLKQAFVALQPHVNAGLGAEAHDADRSRVRVLIRDKLAGVEIPFDVRMFIGTVWADYLTRVRAADGADSDSYAAAVKTMDDMLWSIAAKERAGQKVRLSQMVPPLVRSLRAGAAAVQVSGEKMKRFLDTLYELHIAAIKPREPGSAGTSPSSSPVVTSLLAGKRIANLHDFVADAVLGTWFAFESNGTRVEARLSWISPLRVTYLFAPRSLSEVIVFTPEELAWAMSTGKATLLLEPVPLFDRAVSVTLEHLAERKAKRDAGAPEATADRPVPEPA